MNRLIKPTCMQIFQTASSTRWNRFKWIGGFVLLAVIVSATVLIVTLQQVYTCIAPVKRSCYPVSEMAAR
jgi:hypothetical protein